MAPSLAHTLAELELLLPELSAYDRRFSATMRAALEGRRLSHALFTDSIDAAASDAPGVVASLATHAHLEMLCAQYDEFTDAERIQLQDFVQSHPRLHSPLLDIVTRAGNAMRFESGEGLLRQGLVAAVLSDNLPDYRDWTLAVDYLHSCARSTGLDERARWEAAAGEALSERTRAALLKQAASSTI